MRIALLDHDRSQTDMMCLALTPAGHVCDSFSQGRDLLAHMRKECYDMLILDWQVADMNGAEVLRRAREKMQVHAPVAFLADYAGSNDIVAGLDAGADDYMLKPLRRGEIVARVQALLRRAYPAGPGSTGPAHVTFGPYAFDIGLGRVLMDGSVLELTQKEFALALLFFRNIGRPLSRAYIHDEIWLRDSFIASRTLDTHVSRVRNKLRLKPEHGYRLMPVYSFGYRLEQLAPPD
ncbi:MAG: DNA-binding response OmpR family regulator [Janthinobacterium sp.]|jgi:DNA-binding response OmpR family regulator